MFAISSWFHRLLKIPIPAPATLVATFITLAACGGVGPDDAGGAGGSGGSGGDAGTAGGAGGSAGSGGAACTELPCDGAVCPPAGPFGTEIGDTVEGLSFLDCDGEPVSLHDLCGAKVGAIANFYGWCASCWGTSSLVGDLTAEHYDEGMRSIVVVVEDSYEEPPTPEYCASARDYFGVDLVVRDPDHLIETYGQTDMVMLLDPNGVILFKREDASHVAITAAVDAAL